MALTLNRRAAEIADRMATHATDLGIAVAHLKNGARVIDCGIAADGGLEVGRLMAEICLGGRATVSVTTVELGDLFLPAVRVAVDGPVEPCLASQYAGWAIHRPGRLLRPAAPALGASRAAGRRGRRPSRRSPRPPRRLREGRRDGIQSGPARPRLPAAHVPRRRTGVARGLPGQARGPELLGPWCAPGTVEMPTLEALWQAYRERGLVVIGVSVDRGAPRGSLAPYLDHQRLTFPIVLDPISRRPRPGA